MVLLYYILSVYVQDLVKKILLGPCDLKGSRDGVWTQNAVNFPGPEQETEYIDFLLYMELSQTVACTSNTISWRNSFALTISHWVY